MRTHHLLLPLLLALMLCSCEPGIGGIVGTSELEVRLIGDAALTPLPELDAPHQTLAAQLLANRWSTFDMGYSLTYGHGNLRLTAGTYSSSTAPLDPMESPSFLDYTYPRTEVVEINDNTVTWHINATSADYDLTLVGTFSRKTADALIRQVSGNKGYSILRSPDSMEVRWDVTGTVGSDAMNESYTQVFHAESVVEEVPI